MRRCPGMSGLARVHGLLRTAAVSSSDSLKDSVDIRCKLPKRMACRRSAIAARGVLASLTRHGALHECDRYSSKKPASSCKTIKSLVV